MDSYVRVKIKGTLETLSALHVSSGEEGEYKDKDKENESRHYDQLCLGVNERPFIPASTIRGVLRGFAEQHDQKMANCLFGCSNDDENRVSGKLRFYDAVLSSLNCPEALKEHHEIQKKKYNKNQGFINFRIALNPLLGVAEENKLFASEYVPLGSIFEVELEVDNIDETDVKDILGLLECFDGTEQATLGKGLSQGQGKVRWKCEEVSYLNLKQLENWLNDQDKALEYTTLQGIEPTKINVSKSVQKIEIKLDFSAPFLVNDAYLVKEKEEKENKDILDEDIHDLEFSRLPTGESIIPASSLRGILRGQCQKILNTRFPQYPDLKKLLDNLFGTTEQRSLLWITDAVGNSKENHEQMFNAIDRFTGGAKEGALYQVNAAQKQILTLTVSLDKRQALEDLEKWEKGLLLLVARDALEGDLVCGWGKARGFGAFKAILFDPDKKQLSTWQQLIENVGKENAKNWLDAFDNLKINNTDELKKDKHR
jgi:CRISPR/Cas system CSM-associated protein Csm3 (group 7 of RAMP superfamily)